VKVSCSGRIDGDGEREGNSSLAVNRCASCLPWVSAFRQISTSPHREFRFCNWASLGKGFRSASLKDYDTKLHPHTQLIRTGRSRYHAPTAASSATDQIYMDSGGDAVPRASSGDLSGMRSRQQDVVDAVGHDQDRAVGDDVRTEWTPRPPSRAGKYSLGQCERHDDLTARTLPASAKGSRCRPTWCARMGHAVC